MPVDGAGIGKCQKASYRKLERGVFSGESRPLVLDLEA
jgi:hypothetical protein